jgi:hypothetical protein
MTNYFRGGIAFINHHDPYAYTLKYGTFNQFKYSPLCALLMAGLARLNPIAPVDALWVLLGMGTFFFGLSRWINFSGKLRSILPLALIACVVEVSVSLSVKQINALIIGWILIGLAEYRDGRLWSSGAILMIATNFKVYPIIFLLPLAFPFKRSYWLGALGGGLFAFLFPVLFVGWSHNLQTHLAWVHVVINESSGVGALDIFSTLQRAGLATLGQILRWFVLLLFLPLFFGYAFFSKKLDWRPWMTFGIASVLLLSPRTEVFTYVLLAPFYLLMVNWCMDSRTRLVQKAGPICFTMLAALMASCAYIDPEWMTSEKPFQILRVISTFGYWLLSGVALGNALLKTKRERQVTPLQAV